MIADGGTTIPDVHNYEHITRRARQIAGRRKPRAALVMPCDEDTLDAFLKIIAEGLIDPVVFTDEQPAAKRISKLDRSSAGTRIVSAASPEEAYVAAVSTAVRGEVDLIVCGRITPVYLLRILLDKDAGFIDAERTLSHIAVMKPARYEKLLLVSDAAVNMEPNLRCKLAIVNNAVSVARNLGITTPRVAVIAAVERVLPQMPATVDAAVIARMGDRGQIKDALVDGPLSFDVAVDPTAARTKGISDSPVAGQADILIAPNIESANGIYRAMSLYGRAEVGGIIYGGRTPVVYNARSEPAGNKLNSIVLGTVLAAR